MSEANARRYSGSGSSVCYVAFSAGSTFWMISTMIPAGPAIMKCRCPHSSVFGFETISTSEFFRSLKASSAFSTSNE